MDELDQPLLQPMFRQDQPGANVPTALPFRLTPSDCMSQTWLKLRTHYRERLAELRDANDTDQPERETIALRAQIKEVKLFLELEEQFKLIEPFEGIGLST